MTDVLRIAHPQNCPPYGNSRVGICEGNRPIIQNTRQAIFRERFFENVQNIDSESKKDDR